MLFSRKYYSCIISILLKRGLYHMTENRNHGFRIRFYWTYFNSCRLSHRIFQLPKTMTLKKSMKMEKLFPSVQAMTIKNQP